MQLHTLYPALAFLGAASTASAASLLKSRDLTISSNARISTYDASLGTQNTLTTVNAGVTYWLSGGSTHNFFGNIRNYGNIIVSQTDFLVTDPHEGGQTSDWVGHDASNGNLVNAAGASIVLNDIGSYSAPTYDWYLHTIQNNGTIQWCGRGDSGGSTYQMYCDIDCFNYGLIDFEQALGNLGASYVWRNAALSPPGSAAVANTYNYGTVRLVNLVFHSVQNVLGNGCWQIGANAVLYLEDGAGYYQNPQLGPTFPQQSITFTDSTAGLHMDTQVYSHNPNFGARVYNFGTGNVIEFYESISSFSYNAVNGTLDVTFTSHNQVCITIGTGYVSSSFRQGRKPIFYNTAGYNGIFYDGAPPAQAQPATCTVQAAVCSTDLNSAIPPVIIGYTTITTGYPGTVTTTTTVSPSGTVSGTVIVETPTSATGYVTITTGYPGSVTTTATVWPSGTVSGTVIIETPTSVTGYVTITSGYPGSVKSTSTIPPSGTVSGTVIIETPTQTSATGYVTITSGYSGTVKSTLTIPPTGTVSGTVIVETPTQTSTIGYVTITTGYSGTVKSTITISPSGTVSGTKIIETPTQSSATGYVTITTGYSGTVRTTSTIKPSGTVSGTKIIETPTQSLATGYVTITTGYPGSSLTTSTIPPSGTVSGTIIVETPTTQPGTVTVWTTYTTVWTGSVTTTITISPSGTASGTVIVGTPTPSNTPSTDGTCGNGITCLGSVFGSCCSSAGWCGSTAAYCGTGCQPLFGNCGLSSSSTPQTSPSSTQASSSVSQTSTSSGPTSSPATTSSTQITQSSSQACPQISYVTKTVTSWLPATTA